MYAWYPTNNRQTHTHKHAVASPHCTVQAHPRHITPCGIRGARVCWVSVDVLSRSELIDPPPPPQQTNTRPRTPSVLIRRGGDALAGTRVDAEVRFRKRHTICDQLAGRDLSCGGWGFGQPISLFLQASQVPSHAPFQAPLTCMPFTRGTPDR